MEYLGFKKILKKTQLLRKSLSIRKTMLSLRYKKTN